MRLIAIARRHWSLQARRHAGTEVAATYDAALAEAMTLAPLFRDQCAIHESLAAVQSVPLLPASARWIAGALLVAAVTIAAALISPAPSVVAVVLAAVFGLAATTAADRLGATLRGMSAPANAIGWARQASAAATDAAVAAVMPISALLINRSSLTGAGLAGLMAIAAAVGFAARVGDAETEARLAARATASSRRETTERAVHRAIAALDAAHTAHLARIAAECGYPALQANAGAIIDEMHPHRLTHATPGAAARA